MKQHAGTNCRSLKPSSRSESHAHVLNSALPILATRNTLVDFVNICTHRLFVNWGSQCLQRFNAPWCVAQGWMFRQVLYGPLCQFGHIAGRGYGLVQRCPRMPRLNSPLGPRNLQPLRHALVPNEAVQAALPHIPKNCLNSTILRKTRKFCTST